MANKIKINDQVLVSTGKDKGKTGKVTQILPDKMQVVVDGINVMYKHMRPQRKNDKGQRVQFNGPISLSNVLLLCPKCGKPTRIGFKVSKAEAGEQKAKVSKTRVCKKCQEVID